MDQASSKPVSSERATLDHQRRARTVNGMRTLHRNSRRRHGILGKASTFIEFALVLPAFLFVLIFTIDMGTVILVSGAMQDAVYSSARIGAQAGGAGLDTTGTLVCSNGISCTSGLSYKRFQEAVAAIPVSQGSTIEAGSTFIINTGAYCSQAGGTDDHVSITVDYPVHLMTPGLSTLLRMLSSQKGGSTTDAGWTLSAAGVARCEVARG